MNVKHTKSKKKTAKEILETLKKFPRIDFEGYLYFEIGKEAYIQVKEARAEVKKIRSKQPKDGKLYRLGEKGIALLHEINKQENIAIIFTAMCLEACIWDYAACGTSKNKTKENFESLNLVGKWIIIPKFLCDLDITTKRIGSTCLLDKLRKLKKARDSFAHPKSKPLPNNVMEALKATIPKEKEISAEDAFRLIGLLLGELEKVDTTNWWFFQTDKYKNSIKKAQESTAS